MSILIDKNTKLVVQGITGREGGFHTQKMIEYGTNVVAGVTPGKGGEKVLGVPVFDSVDSAVKEKGADTAVIFVPAAFAPDAIIEAALTGIKLIVCITEGIPVIDMAKVMSIINKMGVKLIGPNCPGIISPGKAKIGIMPGYIHKQGNIGVISRSGTLTYEIVYNLTKDNLGQSTCIGIGGDPVTGMYFIDCLKEFKDDKETEAVVIIGEIGGSSEEEAAVYIKREFNKPVVAFIAGQTAPPGKRMGHAGAIISGGKGTALEKIKVLQDCGIKVAKTPSEIPGLIRSALTH
ncbi:MAG: succinate--CoA ligase subunit alpha [Candidatus Hydrogenedentota bacterium]